MNLTYLKLELTRLRRDPVLLLIVIVLPVFFFVGASMAIPPDLGPTMRVETIHSVMIGLACYGAATAASTITGQTALERIHGWGRQLGLTPLPTANYLGVKAAVALVAVAASVTVMFTVATITGVNGALLSWLTAGIVVTLAALTWALYGMVVGLTFRSQSALAASAAGLVLLALAGGVFVPLPDHLIAYARWTPMYGHVELGRLAFTRGPVEWGAVLWPLANWVLWTGLLGALAARLVRRSRRRG